MRMCKKFICIRIQKHWRLSLVQVRNVYWLLEFSLRHEERETQFLLCWPFHLTQQTRSASRRPNWTGLAQAKKSTRFVQRQISTHCFFQKSPKFPAHRFRAWHHSHPSPISYLGFLLWHLWLSHPQHTSMNTCAQCVYLHVH